MRTAGHCYSPVHAVSVVSVGRAENNRLARMGPYAIPKEMVSAGIHPDIRADHASISMFMRV